MSRPRHRNTDTASVGFVEGMTAVRWLGPGLLALGVALLVGAVATGGAQLAVVVIVPVIVGGASLLFLAGVASIFVGIFLLPLAFAAPSAETVAVLPSASSAEAGESGGLVLIGPLPIFFASWKTAGRRTYWVAAGAGLAVLVVLIVVALALA